MKLFIVGATGFTGLLLVDESLKRGHHVVTLVRNPEKITTVDEKLQIVKGDIQNAAELGRFMQGCDAVLCSVGGRPGIFTPCDIYSTVGKALTSAMRQTGLKRLVAVTAWGTKDDPRLPFIWRWVLKPSMLRNLVRDMELMEDYLASDCPDINYTVVRPPRLTRNSSEGHVVVEEGQCVEGAASEICRQDLAGFMLDCLTTHEYDGKMVSVATQKKE